MTTVREKNGLLNLPRAALDRLRNLSDPTVCLSVSLPACLPALPACPPVLCHAVTTYATKPGHNFTFATVAGAGHMVPTHKPPQALALLKRFLANEPL